jgi:hypothetical protein
MHILRVCTGNGTFSTNNVVHVHTCAQNRVYLYVQYQKDSTRFVISFLTVHYRSSAVLYKTNLEQYIMIIVTYQTQDMTHEAEREFTTLNDAKQFEQDITADGGIAHIEED